MEQTHAALFPMGILSAHMRHVIISFDFKHKREHNHKQTHVLTHRRVWAISSFSPIYVRLRYPSRKQCGSVWNSGVVTNSLSFSLDHNFALSSHCFATLRIWDFWLKRGRDEGRATYDYDKYIHYFPRFSFTFDCETHRASNASPRGTPVP